MTSRLFTAAQLETLRTEYTKIESIDPAAPAAGWMMAYLDKLDTDRLAQLARAKIKWISPLAVNQCNRLGIAWRIGS